MSLKEEETVKGSEREIERERETETSAERRDDKTCGEGHISLERDT